MASLDCLPTPLDLAALPRIGHGASADVFRLPGDRALKLLLPGLPAGIAAREMAATRVAHAAGLPVPAPLGEMALDGRHGLLIERIDEARWLRRVRRWPGAVMVTLDDMARHQAALHRLTPAAGALPPVHEALAARIDGSLAGPHAIAAAQAALAKAPRGDRLLHGDLHLGNVMNDRRGLVLIDWAQAMTGDPAADVARSELVMRFGRYRPFLQRHRWPRLARDAAAAWYLTCYRRTSGMSDAAIDAWRLPFAVAWLREGSAAHLPTLHDYVARRLCEAPRAARRPAAPAAQRAS